MDAIPDATDEDIKTIPNIMCTFHRWMVRQGRKEATARTYARQMIVLFQDDGKSPEGMATKEYFDVTKASFKNKSGNSQRSASVKCFMEFWADHRNKPMEDAKGAPMYQVKGRPSRSRSQDLAALSAAETPEGRKLRAELDLPKEGWSVVVRTRETGDLITAVSPGGTAYYTREAVDRRLGRSSKGSTPGASGSSSAPKKESLRTAPPKAGAGKAPEVKAPAKAPETKAPAKAPTKVPDAKAPAKAPDAKAPAKAPEARAPAKAPDAKVAAKAPEAKAPAKAPEAKGAAKAPDSKAAAKPPEAKAAAKAPEAKAAAKAPEAKTPKAPEAKTPPKSPEAKAAKAPEAKAAAKAPEAKAAAAKAEVPESKSPAKAPEPKPPAKAPEPKPPAKAPEAKPPAKAPEPKPPAKAPEAPEPKSPAKALEPKPPAEALEAKAPAKAPEPKPPAKAPEPKMPAKAPEAQAPAKAPEPKAPAKAPAPEAKPSSAGGGPETSAPPTEPTAASSAPEATAASPAPEASSPKPTAAAEAAEPEASSAKPAAAAEAAEPEASSSKPAAAAEAAEPEAEPEGRGKAEEPKEPKAEAETAAKEPAKQDSKDEESLEQKAKRPKIQVQEVPPGDLTTPTVETDTEYSEVDLSDCPQKIQIQASGNHKFDGSYFRLLAPSRGRPCYVKWGEKQPSYLFWNKKWKIGLEFGTTKAYAYAKDAGPSTPCEPYPSIWKVVEKKDKKEKKEKGKEKESKSYIKNLAMRVIDAAVLDIATESDAMLFLQPDEDVGPVRKNRRRSQSSSSRGSQAAEAEKGAFARPEAVDADGAQPSSTDLLEGSQEEEEQESSREGSESNSSDSSSSASASESESEEQRPKAKAAPPKPGSWQMTEQKAAEFEAKLRGELSKLKDPAARQKKFDVVKDMLLKRIDGLEQVAGMGPERVQLLLDRLTKDFGTNKPPLPKPINPRPPPKPKPPSQPPPPWLLEKQRQEGGGPGRSLEDQQLAVPTVPEQAPFTSSFESDASARPKWPKRSALRKPGAPRQTQRKVTYLADGWMVNQVSVTSWRREGETLWWLQPGSFVICDCCDKEVPQAMGSLQGAMGQSQFAQNSFICSDCSGF